MSEKARDLSEVTEASLICRDLGHAWQWNTDLGVVRERKRVVAVIRDLVCTRCACTRNETVAVRTGVRTRTRYTYPDHYRTHQQGRILADDVRAEWLGRKGYR